MPHIQSNHCFSRTHHSQISNTCIRISSDRCHILKHIFIQAIVLLNCSIISASVRGLVICRSKSLFIYTINITYLVVFSIGWRSRNVVGQEAKYRPQKIWYSGDSQWRMFNAPYLQTIDCCMKNKCYIKIDFSSKKYHSSALFYVYTVISF